MFILRIIFIYFFFISISNSYSQTLKISVKDSDRKPLSGATVQLLKISDSTLTYKTTDLQGIAIFNTINYSLYKVRISFIGYQPLDKSINVKPENLFFNFQLKEDVISISEATVTAKKPLITQEEDKMIIDPEPLVSIATNTLDVLESTPGLYVDQDGGIFLSSTTPAVVYINGREQKMSNQDIATLLKSLPPGSVQKIEVIRTPSSKYDAASSGGIINIVLKKGVKIGRFGSANAGMNQGALGNRFAGVSFNNSGEKSTSYVNLNFNSNNLLEELESSRKLNNDTTIFQTANTDRFSDNIYLGYGITYDIKDSLSFNYDGRINIGFPYSVSNNGNEVNNSSNILLTEFKNLTESESKFFSVQQDFGIIKQYDTLGTQWDTKLGYSLNSNVNNQNYSNSFISPISFTQSGNGDNTQIRHFIQFQSDFTYAFSKNLKLETGVKSSFQLYTSTSDYFLNVNNVSINDSARTSAFTYDEKINSAYAQITKTFKSHFILKTGLRVEHTYMNGIQAIPVDTGFKINRADLFPYLYLSRRVFAVMGFELRGYIIYRRTLQRPGYQNLNPYIKLIDPLMYETGNPSLTPQFTDNVEVNISFDDHPLFAFGRNYTQDIFSEVIYRDPDNPQVLIRTYDNLGKSKETYLRAMAGIPPGGKYFFAIGGQYNFNEYSGFYEGNPLTFEKGSWRFFSFHSLKLFPNTKLTLSGFFMYKGMYNFYELEPFGSINFGVNQTFFNKKLTISLSARDLFKTMITEFTLNQNNIYSMGSRYTDNQRFGINIRYDFGLKTKEKPKMPGEENME